MRKENMTIRIESDLKQQASTLFKSLGLDLSTATGIFFRQALRCQGLPFDVKLYDSNVMGKEAGNKSNANGNLDVVSDFIEKLSSNLSSQEYLGRKKYIEALKSMERDEIFRQDDKYIRDFCNAIKEQKVISNEK